MGTDRRKDIINTIFLNLFVLLSKVGLIYQSCFTRCHNANHAKQKNVLRKFPCPKCQVCTKLRGFFPECECIILLSFNKVSETYFLTKCVIRHS